MTMIRPRLLVAALALASPGLLVSPAHATCLMRGETAAAGMTLVLKGPGGKRELKRKTDSAGMVRLRGLKAGQWQVRVEGSSLPVMMMVAKDGRLEISAVSATITCSPPGGPATTSTSVQLRQRK
jgi:hypothetical protein